MAVHTFQGIFLHTRLKFHGRLIKLQTNALVPSSFPHPEVKDSSISYIASFKHPPHPKVKLNDIFPSPNATRPHSVPPLLFYLP